MFWIEISVCSSEQQRYIMSMAKDCELILWFIGFSLAFMPTNYLWIKYQDYVEILTINKNLEKYKYSYI